MRSRFDGFGVFCESIFPSNEIVDAFNTFRLADLSMSGTIFFHLSNRNDNDVDLVAFLSKFKMAD